MRMYSDVDRRPMRDRLGGRHGSPRRYRSRDRSRSPRSPSPPTFYSRAGVLKRDARRPVRSPSPVRSSPVRSRAAAPLTMAMVPRFRHRGRLTIRAASSSPEDKRGKSPLTRASFLGPTGDEPVDRQECRNIVISVKRKLPKHIEPQKMRGKKFDVKKLVVYHSNDEGKKPLFERPSIIAAWLQELAPEEEEEKRITFRKRRAGSGSRSPDAFRKRRRSEEGTPPPRGSVRDRLGSRVGQVTSSSSLRPRRGGRLAGRLGRRRDEDGDTDPDEEPEDFSARPRENIPVWVLNPEIVPKGRGYYEHDDRDEDPRERDAFGFRGRGRGRGFRGGFRGRGGRFGDSGSRFRRRMSPTLWEHDKFEEATKGGEPMDTSTGGD